MLKTFPVWYKAFIAFIALFALLSSAVFAQGTRQVDDQWVWSAAGGAVHQFSANLSDGPGDLSVTRGFLSAGMG